MNSVSVYLPPAMRRRAFLHLTWARMSELGLPLLAHKTTIPREPSLSRYAGAKTFTLGNSRAKASSMDTAWPRRDPVRKRYPTRIVASAGAAVAVGIGYMDPGNWATDLDAARFGASLLWAILLSGLAAAALQILVVRFTAASDSDLMQAIAARFPASRNALWVSYAFSIIATELAEFVGLVVGLQLVLNVSSLLAIALAVVILGSLLFIGGASPSRFKIVAIAATVVLACAYAYELATIHPAFGPIVAGAVTPHVESFGALLAVVGIVGATIMPHNLFLHSGLLRETLQSVPRNAHPGVAREAIVATIVTLAAASVVNGAIAVVGSSTHATTIESAFRTLRPLAGPAAATLFGFALIAAALAASVSGVCAGDIVCGSGAPFRLSRLQRRALAIGPAVVLLVVGCSPMVLLLASQVALGVVLPAVVVPLVVLVLGQSSMMMRLVDRVLLIVCAGLVVATCACDGVVLTSLFPKLSF